MEVDYTIKVTDVYTTCRNTRSFSITDGSPIQYVNCVGLLPANVEDGDIISMPIQLMVKRARLADPEITTYDFDIRYTDTENNESYLLYGESGQMYPQGTYNNGYESFEITGLPYGINYVYEIVVVAPEGDDCSGETSEISFSKANFSLSLNGGKARFEKCYPGQILDIDVHVAHNVGQCDEPGSFIFQLQKVETNGSVTDLDAVEIIPGSDKTVSHTFAGLDLADGQYRMTAVGADSKLFAQVAKSIDFEVSSSDLKVVIDETTVQHVTCAGGADGAATATAIGDYRSYHYAWFRAGDETNMISNAPRATGLSAGEYIVKVGAENDCVGDYSQSATVVIEDGLVMNEAELLDPVGCDIEAVLPNAESGHDYTFKWIKEMYFVASFGASIPFGEMVTFPRNSDDVIETGNKLQFIVPKRGGNPGETEIVNIAVVRMRAFMDRVQHNSGLTEDIYSASRLTIIKPGYRYMVKVSTKEGCESAVSIPKYVAPADEARAYSLYMRWTTVPQEMQREAPEQIGEKSPKPQSQKREEMVARQAAQCKAKKEANRKVLEGEFCRNLDNITDEMQLSYNVKAQHFTLYYYDRAGNLTKTIPPAGVFAGDDVDPVSQLKTHTLATSYQYNSLQQLVSQHSPDGGTTQFIYNQLGQLRFSQNEEQAKLENNQFSYSRYDHLGRIVEVGQCELADGETLAGLQAYAGDMSFPQTAVSEQTFTTYSTTSGNVLDNGSEQRNLLNRISNTRHINKDGEEARTYYSYDPHGNVDWLEQHVPGLEAKRIDYAYDLISGKVTQVSYNRGQADAFYHRYSYDEDNRITAVETSTDAIIWNQDATYKYYKHGPLKRTTLGHQHVQGLDYVYTINGWLKAINHPSLDSDLDPGKDGSPVTMDGQTSGRDVFGMMLAYFDGDFRNSNSVFDGSDYERAAATDLFNGNIAAWTHNTATKGEDGNTNYNQAEGQQFEYDALNRILSSNFAEYDGSGWQSTADFHSNYTYDGNGNIKTLVRNGSSTQGNLAMDQLTYQYKSGTNQLDHVTDAVAAPENGESTHDIQTQDQGNYEYDAIGNLVADNSEKMQIEWTVAGKVASITKTQGTDEISDDIKIDFNYDASGNRIKKSVTDKGMVTSTYYVRDASGNILSVYSEIDQEQGAGMIARTLELKEQPIYGSSRVGQRISNEILREQVKIGGGVFSDVTLAGNVNVENTLNTWSLPTAQNGAVNSVSFATATFNADEQGVWTRSLTNGTKEVDATNFNPVVTANTPDGELAFTFGTTDDGFRLLDATGIIQHPAVDPINAQSGYAAQVIPFPGSSQSYLLLTIGDDDRLYGRRINVNGSGLSTGETNIVLGEGPYLNGMIAVSDERQDVNTASVYLLQSTTTGVTHLIPVNISKEDGALTALQGEPVATYPLEANLYERHYFSFSGDGRKLAVGIQDNTGDVQVAVLHYNLIDHVLTPLQEDNLQNKLPYFYSMIWGPDQNSLYFISELWGNNMVGAISLGDGSLQTQDINYQASLIQGADDQVYLVGADKDVVQQVQLSAEGLTLQDQDDLALGTASDATFTGRVPEAPLQITTRTPQLVYNHTLGRRHYELTDHLGNVRVVVTDQRLKYNSSDDTYYADLYSSSKYYPFGMLINAGLGNSENYRFGFNGKEKDDQGEWGMTHYDYGFRIYNPAIARFLSVDPLTDNYAYWSPYAFAGNTPIQALDLDGLEILGYKSMFKIKISKSRHVHSYAIFTQSGSSLNIHNKRNSKTYGQGYWSDTYITVVSNDFQGESAKYFAFKGSPNYSSGTIYDPLQAGVDKKMIIDFAKSLEGGPNPTNSAYDANYRTIVRGNNVNAKGGGIASLIILTCKAVYDFTPDAIARDNTKDYINQINAYRLAFDAIDNVYSNEYPGDLWDSLTKGVDSQVFKGKVAQYIVDGYMPHDGKYNDKVKEFGDYVNKTYKRKEGTNLDTRIERNSNRINN